MTWRCELGNSVVIADVVIKRSTPSPRAARTTTPRVAAASSASRLLRLLLTLTFASTFVLCPLRAHLFSAARKSREGALRLSAMVERRLGLKLRDGTRKERRHRRGKIAQEEDLAR